MTFKKWQDPKTGTRWVIEEPTTLNRLLHLGCVAFLCAALIVGFAWAFYLLFSPLLGP